ncbi:MAG TPA: carbohydrate porin [Rhodopila sp.]|jgi:carbohydrate-selective porin OprB
MFDSINAMGKQMAASGIYPTLGYVEDFSWLTTGGQESKHGGHPIGHATAGVTFDLETIAGIPGASLHVIIEERNGNAIQGSPAEVSLPLQADAGPVKYRLTQFFWEQGFDHDRIDIQVGRTEPTLEFAVSDISCQFVTSIICAQPGTWYFANKNGAYPATEWGGRVNLAITPEIYAKVGAYDDDPGGNGFQSAGFDWNTSKSTGVFAIAELGYLTGFSAVQLPAKYDAGFYYDTSQYTLGDVPKNPTKTDRVAGYIQLQQTVWRPDRSTNQSLTVFGGALIYDNSAAYRGQYYAGLFDRAPFASRPLDTIGLIGTLVDINVSNTRTATSPGAPWSREWIMELNYGIGLAPGVTLKPYVNYVVDPFNQAEPTNKFKNEVIVGGQISIALDQLFGFPVFVPH